ncbi:zinc-dependent metalloprotease [Demequina sp. NBRC 110052]|uniref:zinc-dependent metalloprotease n=1 Tax=Demequina sp. NBRC 110052 TaxID=1570341 RepID=UPI001F1EAD92|nr:zinc-dependent metalloprotease [Demequina sp. NBRC 110052]
MNDDQTPWMRLLRELFGDDAEAALEELQRMGMDPQALAAASGMTASPAMMDHVLSQIRTLLSQSDGQTVNWQLAHDVARGVAAQGGDPTVTASIAATHREAVSRAELWLDAVTDLDPSRLEPRVWSRAEWVEATLPTWRVLAGPVAESVSQALGGVLSQEIGGEDAELAAVLGSQAGGMLASVSPTVCGMHMGQAAGQMAQETFGGTDLGLPLLPEPRVALVPGAISAFAEGLEVPEDQVRVYLALREAAHVRLFQAAAWLPGTLHALVERYSAGIRIDLDALDSAVREAGHGDPSTLQQALTKGIFTPHADDEQQATLASIETLLALIEGWVQDVVTRAAAPHVAQVGALGEMMRRRRAAGGPAEDAFANLLGLELRPRRMRDAAALWAALASRGGPEARDAVWSHPDLLPTAEDLDDWTAWVERRLTGDDDDTMDRELERLLGGGTDADPANDLDADGPDESESPGRE